jgi:outer membrane biosynthesis protein TonB
VKFSRIEAIGLLGVMLAAFAACEYLPFMSSKPPPPPPVEVTATPTPSATLTPTSTPTPEVKKRKRRKRSTQTATPESAASPTPEAEASPAASTVITTGESGQARGEIERTIKGVEAHLSGIKRGQLNSQEAADYDRIKSFVAEARVALKEQDDLRAHSLADKAARLTAQLVGRVSNP